MPLSKRRRTGLSAGQNNCLSSKHRDRAMRRHEGAVDSFLQQWYGEVAVTSGGCSPSISGVRMVEGSEVKPSSLACATVTEREFMS
jgi:hypothetical protein